MTRRPKDSTMRFADNRVLVTGATGGMGAAIARAFAAEGAYVIVSGRDRERGAALVAEIESTNGRAGFVPADLQLGGAEIARLAADAANAAGADIDILINNAAVL